MGPVPSCASPAAPTRRQRPLLAADAGARLFRVEGITGWRRHTALVGRPDFAFRSQRVAVFVDGCFWHGCPKHANMPANNRAFWMKKLTGNQNRDRLVTRTLRKEGWRVVRVWEHELRKPVRVLARIRRVLAAV